MNTYQTTRRGKKGKKRKSEFRQRAPSVAAPPKRGRPLTTREYMDLAISKKALNEQRRIENELDRKESIMRLASQELYTSMKLKLDLDEAIENLRTCSNEDISSHARREIDEVLKVAKISKNIKGTCIKTLKQSAVVAAAAVEVLRARADDNVEEDIQYQIKVLKIELNTARAEVREAKEEVARELEEARANNANHTSKSRVLRDSPSPER